MAKNISSNNIEFNDKIQKKKKRRKEKNEKKKY